MKSIYGTIPSTVFDTDKIREYREKSQRYSNKEDLWSWFVLRRLSIFVTLLFIKLRLTPNTISWMSFVGMLSSGFFMMISTPWAFICAFFAYNIGYLLDCVDGEVARITKNTSKKGYFIDLLIQATQLPIFLSFVFCLLQMTDRIFFTVWEALILYGLITAIILSLLVPLSYQLTKVKENEQDPMNKIRSKSIVFDFAGFLLGLPGFYVTLLLLTLLTFFTSINVIFLYIVVFLVILTLKMLVRLYITTRSI
ncbi:CDP-alcohol phosphatidyltransferase family protein [Alkalihalophilus sp. As8PL]|uniref:CDP-alcohol phosphatidyltransferase family protein n=1 Tax=Alkalihalophilus sp. As8PL TaxID=3237103 RepID=A0AB39BP16_9BACI